MTLQQLMYFREICQCKNFHKAAEKLCVSQPCISAAIKKLEAELDLYLFERKGRHIELTKIGNYYYGRINAAINELEAATADVKKLVSSTYGHVDVAFCVPFARDLIPQLVRAFLERSENQKITFGFSQSITPQIIRGIQEDRYDVGFCTQCNEPGLTFVPVARREFVVITPKGHPLADRASIRPSDAAPYPNITYIRETGTYRLIEERFLEEMSSVHFIYRAHDEDSIAALVSAGFGISIVAKVDSLQHANVEIRPLEHPQACFNITMVYQSNQYMPPAVNRFILFAKESLTGMNGGRPG